jgi:hypothetical protein
MATGVNVYRPPLLDDLDVGWRHLGVETERAEQGGHQALCLEVGPITADQPFLVGAPDPDDGIGQRRDLGRDGAQEGRVERPSADEQGDPVAASRALHGHHRAWFAVFHPSQRVPGEDAHPQPLGHPTCSATEASP